MSGAIAAGIGGAVIGGVISSRATKKASQQQADATRYAADKADPFKSQRGYYQDLLKGLYSGAAAGGFAPRTGGMSSGIMGTARLLGPMTASKQPGGRVLTGHDQTGAPVYGRALNPTMEWMKNNPAYQFAQEEGIRGLSRSASASGLLRSGNYLRDLVKYSSGLASQTYESEVNRLMTLSGATAGSPATAGQLSANAAQIQASGSQNAMGQLGYGITQAAPMIGQAAGEFFNPSQGSMISGQTGYQGGVSGVLSGNEFASW